MNRRILKCLACLLFISAGLAHGAKRPNVILILTDDQGWGDLGCYGSPNIETPNIDRLAAQGVRFTSFYAAVFCGPSRAQVMTGCYHARISHSHNEGPGAKTGLNPDEITIAELLKGTGYATMHIGKWHLGDAPEFLPTRQGFDHFFGLPYSNDMWPYHPATRVKDNENELMRKMRARAEYTGFAGQGGAFYYNFPDLPLLRDEKAIEINPDLSQLTTRYTAEALKFIEAHREGPFFLYFAHAMPHVPLFVSDKAGGKSGRGLYGDVMAEIDWSCGQILDKLAELGIDDNTMVIYNSDNGPWLQYGVDGGSAGPFREGKGSVYEGGLRVPAIVRWPGKIPGGRRTEAIAGNIDLLPTIAGAAGVELPGDRTIDGKDLMPLLTGKTNQGPHAYFHYFNGAKPEQGPNYAAIRDTQWKLLVNPGKDGELAAAELYKIGEDPAEKFDRLKMYPEIAEKLLNEARAFRDEIAKNRRPVGRAK